MTFTPTPTAPHAVTLYLPGADGPIGEFTARLVLVHTTTADDSGTWAITHQLGGLANGTHTEVAFVDDTCAGSDPQTDAIAEGIVRLVADALYSRAWAFHYRPEQVPDRVLAYGSRLRERVEITAVQVWNQ